jgi:hypothetical protein
MEVALVAPEMVLMLVLLEVEVPSELFGRGPLGNFHQLAQVTNEFVYSN